MESRLSDKVGVIGLSYTQCEPRSRYTMTAALRSKTTGHRSAEVVGPKLTVFISHRLAERL